MTELYPMQLTPTLHIKVWGGHKLQAVMGKTLFGDSPYGESWELHDTCTVGNGAYSGETLEDLLDDHSAAIIGEDYDAAEGLPLLVKLLDATDWLSVQVHPNNEQAKELEGEPRGKTEAWVILHADPDAKLVIGIEPGTSQEAMAEAIREGELEQLLVYEKVQAGDVLYMPANTVHAIGPGILLYEVQQSSNTTYRLYDWGRVGLDGKARELHIDKGVQVANLETLPPIEHPEGELIVDGEYFRTCRHTLDDTTLELSTAGAMQSLTCVEGEVTVSANGTDAALPKGETVLVPAGLADFVLAGTGDVLRSYLV